MWDWEIREWERNRPPIPSKGPIPLECFRTVSDLLQHTYELEETYMASLEAGACRVTPATERFKRGDRLPRNIEEEIQRENEREHAARRREIEHLEEAEVDINDVLKRPQGAQGALAGTCATRGGPAMMVDPLPDEEHELPGKSPAERARDLRKRGKVLASRGELIKACACYDAALALPTDEIPARERAVVLVNRSVALKRRGRLEDALDDARAAACVDAHTAAKAHVTAAEAERSMGRFWAAARSCEAAAAAADSVGAKAPDETEALRLFCAKETARVEPRLRELERAALTARGDGDAAAEAEALAALGNEQGKLGMFVKARETIEKLLAQATAVDDGAKQSFACGALTALCEASGDAEAAARYRARFLGVGFERARELQRALGGAVNCEGAAAARIEKDQRDARGAQRRHERAAAEKAIDEQERRGLEKLRGAERVAQLDERAAQLGAARVLDEAADSAPICIVVPRANLGLTADDID